MALIYIYQIHQVNSCNDLGHDDSTLNIFLAIIIIIIIIIMTIACCLKMLALDMSAAFVAYGCSFCHGYIANVYGPPAYLVALISVGMLQRIVFFGSANPLPHVIKLVECSSPCDVRIRFADLTSRVHLDLDLYHNFTTKGQFGSVVYWLGR